MNGLSQEGSSKELPRAEGERGREEGNWVQVRNFLMAHRGQVSGPVAVTGMTQVAQVGVRWESIGLWLEW